MRIETIGNATLYLGDCLEVMQSIPFGSVDMILCDLPYGTTACKWDVVIPFAPLWAEYRRVCKKNAAIVLTASQPFTSALVMSNVKEFRYAWVWQKEQGIGFANANKMPMKEHEDVLCFYRALPTYNPQGLKPCNIKKDRKATDVGEYMGSNGVANTSYTQTFTNYPKTVLFFPRSDKGKLHPTQKPVALFEYLIRTYTNEGETVMDNCMGSGTTGVACANTGRRFIGIEKEVKYFDTAYRRIEDAQRRGG